MLPAWPPTRAIFCLVTDRRALAAALGSGGEAVDALREQVAAAVDAGIDLVHLRERDLEAGRLRDLAGQCVELTANSSTRIVLNDRMDVARAAGAAGVHLRGDSITPSRARPLAPPGFLLGRAVRSAGEAGGADPAADYLVLGTIFPTPSKSGTDTVIGVEELARAARAATRPLLAIGGITEERLPAVAQAGTAGVAAIRLFFCKAGEWSRLAPRVARWRRLFDTNKTIS